MKGSLIVEENTFSAASGLLFDWIFKRHSRTPHTCTTDALKFDCNWTIVTISPNILPSHDGYSTFRIINLNLRKNQSVYFSKEIRRAEGKVATELTVIKFSF